MPARVHASTVGEPVGGTLYDLSEGGAFFTAQVEVEVGSAAFATFEIRGQVAEAVGAVMRVHPFDGAQGIGLGFRVGNDVFVDFIDELGRAPEGSRPAMLGAIKELVFRLGD